MSIKLICLIIFALTEAFGSSVRNAVRARGVISVNGYNSTSVQVNVYSDKSGNITRYLEEIANLNATFVNSSKKIHELENKLQKLDEFENKLVRIDEFEKNIMKIEEKFDEGMRKLKEFEKSLQKIGKFEKDLKKLDEFERELARIDEFEGKLSKLDEFENKLHKLDEFEKNIQKIDEFETKLNKIDELEDKLKNFDEIEKNVEKIDKLENDLKKIDELETAIGINTDKVEEMITEATESCSKRCENLEDIKKLINESSAGLLEKLVGTWSEWSEWTKCSEECGDGKRNRTRQCTNSAYGFGCVGSDKEEEVCRITDECPQKLLVFYLSDEFTPEKSNPAIETTGKYKYSRPFIKCKVTGLHAGWNTFEDVRDVLMPLFAGTTNVKISQYRAVVGKDQVAQVSSIDKDYVGEKSKMQYANQAGKSFTYRDVGKVHDLDIIEGGRIFISGNRRTVLNINQK